MCIDKFKSSIISIPSPFNQNQILDLAVEYDSDTKTNVYLINGSPYIDLNIKLKGIVESLEYNLDLTDKNNLKIIEDYAESYLKSKLLDYLYATSKEYHTDTVGFGKYLSYDYLNVKEFQKINWPHLYSDSFFNVNVDIDILSGYLLVQN